MSWSCAQTEEQLGEFLDGLLSSEAQSELNAHAASCARCAMLVAQVGGVVRRVRALEPLEEPPQLVSRILDQTLGPRTPRKGWRGWFGWVPVLWQPRFAMGVVTVAATFLIVFNTSGTTPGKLRKGNLTPSNLYEAANRHAHLVYARGVKFVNDLRVVYEIQSRLRPESAPGRAPETEPPPPPTDHQQKSQSGPHPGRSANRGSILVASILTPDPGRSLR
jgi:anti-sigma factor RsiW